MNQKAKKLSIGTVVTIDSRKAKITRHADQSFISENHYYVRFENAPKCVLDTLISESQITD